MGEEFPSGQVNGDEPAGVVSDPAEQYLQDHPRAVTDPGQAFAEASVVNDMADAANARQRDGEAWQMASEREGIPDAERDQAARESLDAFVAAGTLRTKIPAAAKQAGQDYQMYASREAARRAEAAAAQQPQQDAGALAGSSARGQVSLGGGSINMQRFEDRAAQTGDTSRRPAQAKDGREWQV